MSWIHQHPAWPSLTWDAEVLSTTLAKVRHRQGRHLGRLEGLGFELRAEASLSVLTTEVVASSAIEGEELDRAEVRSSIARRLGIEAAGLPEPSRNVDGVVEMMLDATRACEERLDAERLFAWHAALFPTCRSGMRRITVGAWRNDAGGPMRVVSGRLGRERVHFVAPKAERVAAEMERFLSWFGTSAQTVDPVLRAGVAHLWFLTIHPFDDGNGRIGRAIADMALAHADGTTDRFYSLSSGIAAERSDYYRQLESAQRGGLDVTAWLAWFLGCLDRTIGSADDALRDVLEKARMWERINRHPVNDRQQRVLRRLLDGFEGHLTTSKYAKLAKCSTDTALRDIKGLLDRGLLVQNPGGGRSTSYRFASDVEPAS